MGFGPGTHYTEGSQAARLVEVARRYRVGTVVLQVGANDDAALVDTGIACILAFLDPGAARRAGRRIGPLLDAADGRHRSERCRPPCATCGRRCAGPVTPRPTTSWCWPPTRRRSPSGWCRLAAAQGCPYRRADAAWGRTVLFPRAVRGAAPRSPSAAGARFLDLARATEGREACSRRPAGQEWQRRITVDPAAFVHGGLDAIGYHLAQESFHPNAAAHAEIGRCLGAFVRSGDAERRLRAGRRRPAAAGPHPGRRAGLSGTGPAALVRSEHDEVAGAGVQPLAAVRR